MISPSEPIGKSDSSLEPLPEYWPDRPTPQPIRAVWIPWPIAVVLAPCFWFMPKRMGAHFAEASWWAAIAAHVVWTVYGIGCILIATDAPRHGLVSYLTGQSPGQTYTRFLSPPTVSEVLRSPMALLAEDVSSAITRREDLLMGISIVAGVELLLIVAAGLLMPYAAAGERAPRLFARCIKLTLWSTTSLVALGHVLQGIELTVKRSLDGVPWITACAVYVAWSVWIWLRSGMRYAGPRDGPAWEPRPVRCDGCGYLLTGLTLNDRCPECGWPVTDSLPEVRQPSAYAAASTAWGRIPAFFRTLAGALAGRGFYRRLAVLSEHAEARGFAIRVCLLGGPLAVTTFFVTGLVLEGPRWLWEDFFGPVGKDLMWLTLPTVAMTVLLLALVGIVGLWCSRFGLAPVQQSATILFYHAVWVLPVMLSAIIVACCVSWANDHRYLRGTIELGPFGDLDKFTLFEVALYLIPFVILLIAVFRLSQGFQQTRYANG